MHGSYNMSKRRDRHITTDHKFRIYPHSTLVPLKLRIYSSVLASSVELLQFILKINAYIKYYIPTVYLCSVFVDVVLVSYAVGSSLREKVAMLGNTIHFTKVLCPVCVCHNIFQIVV